MNLAQLFHTHWLACAQLNALLPVGKVLAGPYFPADPGTRYATLTLPGSRAAGLPAACLARETVTVRVRLHHDDYLLGQAIVQAVRDCFAGRRLELHELQRSVQISAGSEPDEREDPRTTEWDWTLDFHCRVEPLPE